MYLSLNRYCTRTVAPNSFHCSLSRLDKDSRPKVLPDPLAEFVATCGRCHESILLLLKALGVALRLYGQLPCRKTIQQCGRVTAQA